jgi:hypothetical protein
LLEHTCLGLPVHHRAHHTNDPKNIGDPIRANGQVGDPKPVQAGRGFQVGWTLKPNDQVRGYRHKGLNGRAQAAANRGEVPEFVWKAVEIRPSHKTIPEPEGYQQIISSGDEGKDPDRGLGEGPPASGIIRDLDWTGRGLSLSRGP